MLLGKRPRTPLKRTTSMKDVVVVVPSDSSKPSDPVISRFSHAGESRNPPNLTPPSPMISLTSMRRSSDSDNYMPSVVDETAPFLRVCALCKGLLRSGRDIFMYRGEIAFCSSECRERQIKFDERKEKAKLSISKNPAPANGEGSKASGNGETAVAA